MGLLFSFVAVQNKARRIRTDTAGRFSQNIAFMNHHCVSISWLHFCVRSGYTLCAIRTLSMASLA